MFLLTTSGLTSQLAVVMYKCTPGPHDITVGRGIPNHTRREVKTDLKLSTNGSEMLQSGAK